MPSFVITEKCDGCKGGDKTASDTVSIRYSNLEN